MDFPTILKITQSVENGNQEEIQEVYTFLESVEKSNIISASLVSAISSQNLTENQKFICLSILKNYKFPIEDPYSLIPLLLSSQEMIVSTTAIIIANHITSEEGIAPILSLTEEYASGVLLIILACSENGYVYGSMIDFVITLFSAIEDAEIKVKAAEAIAELAENVRTNYEVLTQFYREVMQSELNEESLLLINALLPGAGFALPRNEALLYMINYFASIAENCPITYEDPNEVTLYSFTQKLSYEIYYTIFSNNNEYDDEEEEGGLEYDEELLVKSCLLNCLIDEERMAFLNENVEELVNEIEDEYSTRSNCIKILNNPNLVDIAVRECQEIWEESEVHEEAALFVLNGILPKHHYFDISPPVPIDNEFAIGQYVKYIYTYEEDCSSSSLEEALESEGFVLPIIAADALSRSEYFFPDVIVGFVSKMFEVIGIFESDEYSYIISIIARLVALNPAAFAGDFEQLMSTLNDLIRGCALNSGLFNEVCKIFATLSNVPDYHLPIIEMMTPTIVELLSDDSASECGFEMVLAVFCNEEELVSQEAFSAVMTAFFHALQSFEIYDTHGKIAMEIFSYSIRCNEMEFPVSFLTELLGTEINGLYFVYLASVVFGLFCRCEVEGYAGLLKAIMERLSQSQSTIITQGICCAFSAIALENKEAIESILAALETDLPTFLSMFCNFANSWSIISTFDQRICIAGLLQFADVELPDELSVIRSAAEILKQQCSLDYNQKSIAFAPSDPFCKNHIFANQSTKAFIEKVFPDKESLPQDVAEIVEECYNTCV